MREKWKKRRREDENKMVGNPDDDDEEETSGPLETRTPSWSSAPTESAERAERRGHQFFFFSFLIRVKQHRPLLSFFHPFHIYRHRPQMTGGHDDDDVIRISSDDAVERTEPEAMLIVRCDEKKRREPFSLFFIWSSCFRVVIFMGRTHFR